MAVEVYNTFMVCQDCIMFIANGDGPEYLVGGRDGDEKYEKRLEQIVAGVERLQGLCDGGSLVSTSDESTDEEFSPRPCECCRAPRSAGSRFQATLLCNKVTKNMRRNSRGAPVDADEADELKLYIDNDSRLYEMGRSYREALAKRMQKGTFDLALAAKGFEWIAEEGAKKYKREMGGTGQRFAPATRKQVAKEMAKDWHDEYRIEHDIKANRRKRTSRRAKKRTSRGRR